MLMTNGLAFITRYIQLSLEVIFPAREYSDESESKEYGV